MKPIVAITAGDINGVGYEVIIKSLHDAHISELCTPVVYGNLAIAKAHARTLDEEYHALNWNVIDTPQKAKQGTVSLISCYPDNTPLTIGSPSKEAGEAAYLSLQRATGDLQQGLVNALVTAPINKDTIQSDKFRFSGHTEYLAHLFGKENALMLMVSDVMRVALVCNHTPIAEVAGQITEERIMKKVKILSETLKNDFRIENPRIAVLALNPHGGDNGLLGKEEQEIINPAIRKCVDEGIWVFGAYAADGFFGSGRYTHYDAVLAMYHDQGLAPFKTLDMNGVNYTAGLKVVRTSPDHGTAYDLAGKNLASAESMRHAIYTAVDVLKVRQESEELKKNPLPFIEREDKEGRPRPEFRTFGGPKKASGEGEGKVES